MLLNRIGPAHATVYVADANGANERALFPETGLDYNATFSPDGEWVVFTSERSGSADLFRARLDGSGPERLTDDPSYDDQAAVSPDGQRVAFVSTRHTGFANLWVLDLRSRQARCLAAVPAGCFRPSWSPDGKTIAFSSGLDASLRFAPGRWEQLQEYAIFLVSAEGGAPRRLSRAGVSTRSPRWSATGDRVLAYEIAIADTFAVRRAGNRSAEIASQIVSIDVASGRTDVLTSGAGLKTSPQPLAAAAFGYLHRSGVQARLSFGNGEPGPTGLIRNPTWSPDGRHVVYHKLGTDLFAQNRPLFSADERYNFAFTQSFPAYSRDGKWLAIVDNLGVNDPAALSALTIVARDGTAHQIFREAGSLIVTPSWSPDGERLAFGLGSFFANRHKPARIMVVRRDGSGLRELVALAANAGFPSWSRDGKHIVYRVWGENLHGLHILDVERGTSTVLTEGYDNFPAWSPAADTIAFTRREGENFDIYTIAHDGTQLTRLTTAPGHDAHAVWSPDGSKLLFSSARFGFRDEAALVDGIPQPYGELFVMNRDGSDQRALTDNQWEDATPAWDPLGSAPAPEATLSR